MEDSFFNHLQDFINKFITIYVKGTHKTGFSGFVLDVNIHCVTLLSVSDFNTLKAKNIDELFIVKTVIIIPIDKITAVISYTSPNTNIPMQEGFNDEYSSRTDVVKKTSSPFIIGLLAFLVYRLLKGQGNRSIAPVCPAPYITTVSPAIYAPEVSSTIPVTRAHEYAASPIIHPTHTSAARLPLHPTHTSAARLPLHPAHTSAARLPLHPTHISANKLPLHAKHFLF